MKATTCAATRRRDQVVILNGLRPGAKLSTPENSRSDMAHFAVSMLLVLLSGTLMLGSIVMNELHPTPWWALALIASWVPAVAFLVREKGGRK
ncbi:MAG: hypothetical protein NC301_07370 [Bacteroides sp.]|nr:hypothetical protein [Bacteroides sp.]MCM1380014.1 hypothetical protein [Bacteroides sp.]MCM1446306.1 hypothetical protein [Prevotella sp.]